MEQTDLKCLNLKICHAGFNKYLQLNTEKKKKQRNLHVYAAVTSLSVHRTGQLCHKDERQQFISKERVLHSTWAVSNQ